jgi:CheY-like chemotaxis protein
VATEENGAVPCGQGETILVVDDETAVREVTKAILEANGYRVLLASGGKEALALFARHRQAIRLVLTDMMMPEMDGRATIRELRRLDPQVQVVAASGLASDEHSAPEPGAELQAFLMKPFTASKLLRTLHAQLARPNVLLGPANGQGKHETSGVHAG